MSYPSVAFKPVSKIAGIQPLDQTSDVQNHPLGTRIRAVDSTYGEIEAIYLKGVASTAKGDAVTFETKTGATTRSAASARGAVGVALSACVANEYGWYAISGAVPVTAGTVAASGTAYFTSTAGSLDDAVVSGDKIDGAVFQAVASGGFATIQLSNPSANGNG